MKEPATTKGRILKCPMCRVPEKESGKRSTFSYEHELSKLYAPRPARPRDEWATIADSIRHLPLTMRERYIGMFPSLAPYFEPSQPEHRLAREAAIAQAEALIAARRQAERQAQVAPADRAMRPVVVNAFCQGGRREIGGCQTINKTKRKCTYSGCDKFVCRSCRQCLTH